jgi:hypothetical protein
MRYGVTGVARALSLDELTLISDTVARLPVKDGDEFFSGGAVGVDTAFALFAVQYWPNAKHTLVLPRAMWNEAGLIDWIGDAFATVWADKGRNVSQAYMNRNTLLAQSVGRGGQLLAFPDGPDELRRSGTWATVRRGREAGCEIVITPLCNARQTR